MAKATKPSASALATHWALDPDVVFLNHGSFGATPRAVLELQSELRARMEAEPVRFFLRELAPMLDEARVFIGAFLGADADEIAFVRNATAGVNAVLRSVRFVPGDELLVTDHAYGACRNAVDHVASLAGARVVVAEVSFPPRDAASVVAEVLAAVTERTRLALIDHVASPTGLVFPVLELSRALSARGVEVLIDGAHAPGMLGFDDLEGPSLRTLSEAGVRYYTANFHKWTCAPKGAAMLWARRDAQRSLHPTSISHGYRSTHARGRFLEQFDWTGTDDPTPWLCVPGAIRFVGGLVDGGWPSIRAQNRAKVLGGRAQLAVALGVEELAPAAQIGALASLPLPIGAGLERASALAFDPLQDALLERHRIEVPIVPWPTPRARLVRISAFLYNDRSEYARLAEALLEELAREGSVGAG